MRVHITSISSPVEISSKSLGIWNFLFTLVKTSTCIYIYTTSFSLSTLQLRGMDSAAQKTTKSGRITKKTFKVRENDVFTPIPLVPPPKIAKGLFSLPHPQFEPLKRVPFDSMHVLVPIVSALQLFLLLLGEASLAAMVTATNANTTKDWHYDDSFRYQRPWHPLTRNELIRWLGTLIYMGRHRETNSEYYWRTDSHLKLSRAMSKTRWEQIHRFFKINDSDDGDRLPG